MTSWRSSALVGAWPLDFMRESRNVSRKLSNARSYPRDDVAMLPKDKGRVEVRIAEVPRRVGSWRKGGTRAGSYLHVAEEVSPNLSHR